MIDDVEVIDESTSSLGKWCWRLALAQCACRAMALSGSFISVNIGKLNNEITKLLQIVAFLPFIVTLSPLIFSTLSEIVSTMP